MATRILGLGLVALLASCATIQPDEIGVKNTFGKLDDTVQPPGLVLINPLFTRVMRLPARTENYEVDLALPSKEGLNVQTEVSILYRINQDQVLDILTQSGARYEDDIILPVFRSAAADVSSRFMAKDMHSAQRARIEEDILQLMRQYLAERGLIIESVLLKSVQLPPGLARAVEQKLEAEQDAQRMAFVIQQEELEAKRMLIEAQATRDAQQILAEGLTPMILEFRQIEAMERLATSENSKVVITNGQTLLSVEADD